MKASAVFIPYTPSYIFIDHLKPISSIGGLYHELSSNNYLTTMVLHSREAVIPNLSDPPSCQIKECRV